MKRLKQEGWSIQAPESPRSNPLQFPFSNRRSFSTLPSPPSTFKALLVLLLVLLQCMPSQAADAYEIFGELTEYWRPETVGTTGTACFSGMELSSCTLANKKSQYAPDLTKFTPLTGVEMLCLQCCTHTPLRREDWELECEVDNREKNELNVFEMEFRLLRNEYSGDSTILVCPIYRQGCSYDPDTGQLEGDCNDNGLSVTGLTMHLTVQEYHLWFDSWVVVKDCNVTVQEAAAFSGDVWYENYYLTIQEPNFIWTPLHSLLTTLSVGGGVYLVLRVLRTATCLVCGKKLVFARTGHRCFWCWYYDCDLPHPYVVHSFGSKVGSKVGVLAETVSDGSGTDPNSLDSELEDVDEETLPSLTKGTHRHKSRHYSMDHAVDDLYREQRKKYGEDFPRMLLERERQREEQRERAKEEHKRTVQEQERIRRERRANNPLFQLAELAKKSSPSKQEEERRRSSQRHSSKVTPY